MARLSSECAVAAQPTLPVRQRAHQLCLGRRAAVRVNSRSGVGGSRGRLGAEACARDCRRRRRNCAKPVFAECDLHMSQTDTAFHTILLPTAFSTISKGQ